MKIISILLILILTSCHKDYSLEYFQTYQADAPNVLMSKSKDFKSVETILIEKYAYDIFLVSVYYRNSNNIIDSSFGQFNHNGKLLTFKN